MKKIIIMLFGLLLVSGVYAETKPMSFGINFGMMTDDSFKFDYYYPGVGVELDFQLGDYLMLSPEVTLYSIKFEFDTLLLYPGATLNFTASNFFIGGGVVKPIAISGGESYSSDFALKLNAGFLSPSVKFTAYLITAFDNLFKSGMMIGASLGFRF
ncbi:MAG: hypothetical protein KJ808_09665 [Acidobacteria bacterium]|nr:hypothetical protein [Acidobacteriota bacterium]MBU4306911.1 hypothetical protein [Acidobacteriota bacterium]MBU4404367.1 hypothetical protein [Acidobacteriota bacterium]MCG2812485.1 hypothetical protein [Candidatus Aminicenantes bacterium]